MKDDERFMKLALELARKGMGRVSPNPMVGCVIVHDGFVVAEGYHERCGEAHAEINALRSLDFNALGSTLYVTLEPCFHEGRTPPCIDAVIKSHAQRVVIAMPDPNPLTQGKSIQRLKESGIEVQVGVCEGEARELNRVFIKSITTRHPYVMAKVAQSLDGMITAKKGEQCWLTGDETRAKVQQWRASVDAVLVGIGTVNIDDPQLNVRDKGRPQPKRVVLDPELRINTSRRLFQTHGGELILVCLLNGENERVVALRQRGVKVLCVPQATGGRFDLDQVLVELKSQGIQSLLIEGGAGVFSSFLQSGLVDEWLFIVAPRIIGAKGQPAFTTEKSHDLILCESGRFGQDVWFRFLKR